MFKVVRVARFNPDLTWEQGSKHWTEVHGPLGLKVPGLIGYVQNHCIGRIQNIDSTEGRGVADERPLFDGFACEWHADQASFEKDLQTPEWQKCVEDGRKLFDGESIKNMFALVEPRVVREGPRGAFKVAIFLRFKPGLDREEASEHWLNVHAELAKKVPGMGRNVQNLVISAIDGNGLSNDHVNFDGFVEIWFENRQAFENAVVSSEWINDLRSDGDGLFDRDFMKDMCGVVEERVIREEPVE